MILVLSYLLIRLRLFVLPFRLRSAAGNKKGPLGGLSGRVTWQRPIRAAKGASEPLQLR
jgi:hypothetical protein